ncbi:alpha/beta hydrolase [Ancylobacter sp. G4_0304]|uniref:alpha/beta hydrolase n=1 Tax=Ancylobacter sp. G4_0304 TaxID=3114289 RepID=UPI0039C61621
MALAVLAVGAGTIAVAPVAALNALSRLHPIVAVPDQSYAEGDRHGVDVYRPETGTGLPVVVFFYGGGWEEGDRALYRFVGAALAGQGIVTFIPDYRVYPQVRFPDFLDDAARAVRWARDHAREFGGDPSRLVTAGHSAGAHIAAMLAFDPQWLAKAGLDSRRDLAGMAGLAGPYDFLPLHSQTLMDIFGPEAERPLSQPINFVTEGEVPVFLATATADSSVDPANTTRFAARIRAAGGSAETRYYENLSHRTIIGAVAPPLRWLAPVLDDVAGFVYRVTGREGLS